MGDMKKAAASSSGDGRSVQTGGITYTLTSRADIHTTILHYLWEPWLVAGGLNILAGSGGCRKSTFAAWLTARATRGQLPGMTAPARVLYVQQGEDALAEVLMPRLDAAGADPAMYRILATTTPSPVDGTPIPAVPSGTSMRDALARFVTMYDPDFIIIDPLSLLIDGDVSSYEDAQPALVACNMLAQQGQRSRTILGLHHWNRAGTFLGSGKFRDTARCFIDMIVDPLHPDDSVITISKANSASAKSLRIHTALQPYTADDDQTSTVQVVTGTEGTKATVDQLRKIMLGEDDPEEMRDVDKWLIDFLTDRGGSAPYAEIIKAGRAEAGYSADALKRARRRRGITTTRTHTVPATTVWTLPTKAAKGDAQAVAA